MLNKKNTFKQFMQGNGFYIFTGVALIAVVVTAIVFPKKGEGDVAKQPEKYAENRPVAADDINDLRVPTIEPRIDLEDELSITEDTNVQVDDSQDLQSQVPAFEIEEEPDAMVSETFSSTTNEQGELFHGDDDLFVWPIEENVIYQYSDNDIGTSFINPTLDRTMRSFGLFLKAEEEGMVQVAGHGKVLAITQYPTDDIAQDMDYPQVGTAIIVDHGNDWKTVYGLHQGEATVQVGDMVEAGEIVGTVGKPSMDFSLTGANLYFQVLKNDMPVNPMDMLK